MKPLCASLECTALAIDKSQLPAVIPPFHSAIDRAISYLDPNDGFLGVCDFYASGRYDLPCRQLGFLRRFFWRSAKLNMLLDSTLLSHSCISCCMLYVDLSSLVHGFKAKPDMTATTCRATFDTDNIDIGPERRAYLDHRLSRAWEINSQVCHMPFGDTPFLLLVCLDHHRCA